MKYVESVYQEVKKKLEQEYFGEDNIQVELVTDTEHSLRKRTIRIGMKWNRFFGKIQIQPSRNFKVQAKRIVAVFNKCVGKI